MFASTKAILDEARRTNTAVPSPDCIDLDSTRTFIQVAQQLNKPVILAFGEALEGLLPLEEAVGIAKLLTRDVTVPVAVHLDHGKDIANIKHAVDLGFTSVMIDASEKSFEENVALTKEVVEYAHARGVSVEAELGHVGQGAAYNGYEDSDNIYTEVEEAKRFVELTGVDFLAVSIGTAHGVYKNAVQPVLNFERLHELRAALDVPLVLHGGSGTGDENLARCANEGINKVNLFTDFLQAAMREIKSSGAEDYISLKEAANRGMADMLRHYYSVFEKR